MQINGDSSGLDFVVRGVCLDVFGKEMHRGGEALKMRRACLQTSLHFYLLTFGHFAILRVSDDRVPQRPVQAQVVLWRRIKLRPKDLDRMEFNDILMLRI